MAKSTRVKDDAVRIEGLNEVVLRLKALGTGAEAGIRLANREAATRVARGASSAARSLGGVAAYSAPSIKVSAGVKSGGVAIGSDAYPMALGAEFGGQRRSTTQQFRPWLGPTGYFLYPTIRRYSEDINQTYRDALDRVIREAGLE